mmetsp:Transcript_20326/g.39913  ORF Transcript_20326/g.39913 Transcript_20326/m.39913 type:complete len:335 (+) Transcript_20326:70-1074(+)
MDASGRFLAAVERAETALNRRAARRQTSQATTPAPGSFVTETCDTLRKLQSARKTVQGVAEAYSTFVSTQSGGPRGLTDEERDAFDSKMSALVASERARVDSVREDLVALGPARPGSLLAHRQAVVQHLYELLQEVTKASGELQLLRLRHTSTSRKALFANDGKAQDAKIGQLVKEAQKNDRAKADPSHEGLRRRRMNVTESKTSSRVNSEYNAYESDLDSDEDDVFDEGMMHELQTEQTALRARLERELEAVKQAEQQMNEFSQLLSLFNEKIVEQSESVNNIFKDVQTSTNYMDSATDQLHSAKNHNSNFRKYVIIFFAVASILLLILDAMD